MEPEKWLGLKHAYGLEALLLMTELAKIMAYIQDDAAKFILEDFCDPKITAKIILRILELVFFSF